MIFFHRTTRDAADAILAGGFRDATGSYGLVGHTLTGAWLSDIPMDQGEGAKGEVLLEVELRGLDEEALDEFEVELMGRSLGIGFDPFVKREWCIPAEFINAHGNVREVSIEEEEEMDTPMNWGLPRPSPRDDPRIVAWRKSRGFESGGLTDKRCEDEPSDWVWDPPMASA